MGDELKPCPNPECKASDFGSCWREGDRCVQCQACGTCGPYSAIPDLADAAWNALLREPIQGSIVEALAELREAGGKAWDGVADVEAELGRDDEPEHDVVNHPKHYTSHPSGVECIAVAEHMNFNVGNAIKYLWRTDHKNGLEDLRKAAWYVNREIERLEKEATK